MVFLPFYLPRSSLLQKPYLGVGAGALWVGAQVRVCRLSLGSYLSSTFLCRFAKISVPLTDTKPQVLWLQQGYQLEFLGKSTFAPGLWISSLVFFLVNVWILGIIISDVGGRNMTSDVPSVDGNKGRYIANEDDR